MRSIDAARATDRVILEWLADLETRVACIESSLGARRAAPPALVEEVGALIADLARARNDEDLATGTGSPA